MRAILGYFFLILFFPANFHYFVHLPLPVHSAYFSRANYLLNLAFVLFHLISLSPLCTCLLSPTRKMEKKGFLVMLPTKAKNSSLEMDSVVMWCCSFYFERGKERESERRRRQGGSRANNLLLRFGCTGTFHFCWVDTPMR